MPGAAVAAPGTTPLPLVDVRLDVGLVILGLGDPARISTLVRMCLDVGVTFGSLMPIQLVEVVRPLMAIPLVRSHRSSSL